jgi:outer membrane receptor protein involved in Fe transport
VLLLFATRSALGQAPPEVKATGIISGTVVDAATSDPVIDAGVELVGRDQTERTDIDGKFRFAVPPGAYEVRVFAPGYVSVRLKNVFVSAGKIARADAALTLSGRAGMDVVEVVAKADAAAKATQLVKRQKADVVSERVSAEEIRESPDTNAAEVVQRVPAVTIKDNKFIVVRGLDERYSSALLNGSRLPSTDPNKRVIPLDLFPAEFIESLSIVKTFSPELPGDFSGGLADIHLRSFPEKLSYNFGLSLGGNSDVTFQKFNTYTGGGYDYFGIDNARGLPRAIPGRNVGVPPGAQAQTYGRSFKDVWQAKSITAPPNFGVNFSIGDTIGPLGIALAGIYTTEYKTEKNKIIRQFVNGGGSITNPNVTLANDSLYNIDTFQTRLGAILTGSYEISPNHRLNIRSLYDRKTDDDTSLGQTQSSQLDADLNVTQLQWTEDDLAFWQLQGEHRWSGIQLDWQSAYSQSNENIPDTRTTVYSTSNNEPTLPPSFISDQSSGNRVFFNLNEWLSDSSAHFTIPFETGLPGTDVWSGLPAKLKFGPVYTYRDRSTRLRQFQFQPCVGSLCLPNFTDKLTLPPNELFAPGNIGPGGLQFSEVSNPRDSFSATQEIAGGYVMTELPLVRDQVRLIAGVRTEYSYIRVDAADIQGNKLTPRQNNLDPLPGVNLVYSPRPDMNLRAAWSRTVSRPEFRELSPTQFPEPRGLTPTQGNPNLVEAHIESEDVRWEWFLSPLELVSAGYFHKQIDQPIEQVLFQQSSSDLILSFDNAQDATLDGVEVELRKNLGPTAALFKGWTAAPDFLSKLSIDTNITYVQSTVNAPKSATDVQTESKRALQGQAPFVLNAALDYTDARWGTARLLYNRVGEQITALGSFGLPDIKLQPRDELDFALLTQINPFGTPINVKVAAENLIDAKFVSLQGSRVQESYRTGIKFTFGMAYSF